MVIYFISGLGADERAFSKLALPKEWNRIYLGWPEHSSDDTVESYAKKYVSLIDKNSDFALVGLSFGGMIATELAKILRPTKTILVSSISTSMQLPFLLNFVRKTNLVKFTPMNAFRSVPPFSNWYLGIKSSEEKQLLADFVKHCSPEFLKWAIQAIVNWKNDVRPENLFHIHGDNDHIFPISKVNADFIIKDGGHFMIFNKPEVVSKAIINILR